MSRAHVFFAVWCAIWLVVLSLLAGHVGGMSCLLGSVVVYGLMGLFSALLLFLLRLLSRQWMGARSESAYYARRRLHSRAFEVVWLDRLCAERIRL